MQSHRPSRQRGQVLLMVTFALIPMFGMLGLVADFGYMHFVKMSAQTAAEAAAQAAIISYHETVGGSNPNAATPEWCAAPARRTAPRILRLPPIPSSADVCTPKATGSTPLIIGSLIRPAWGVRPLRRRESVIPPIG